MAVAKCIECGAYIDASEVVLVPVDETHDATYCVGCAPDTDDGYDSENDPNY